ncbi:flagellar basal body rod protein FlgB [Paenibacillus mendelii]|uniref:Flagellar basal body rod protein FlgB n=1 Tax=Paenibacillus mendelii TaxID=206163 RepID=A0ABV6JKI8_9BACL|nr:flagellar basal body rod protein FlgB [Paenibacillus mendelii]MCQ6557925.1 flagellar basal body rod protein FlgB [Paenibacillus mendelii]
MNLLNGPVFKRLEGAISAAELRQKVASNNVANVDTPNFKRSEVIFEQLLEQQMGNNASQINGKRTDTRHFVIGQSGSVPGAEIVTDENTVMNNNSNNVDIEREMTLLAKNQLTYNYYIQQVNHEMKMMRTAIEGRA